MLYAPIPAASLSSRLAGQRVWPSPRLSDVTYCDNATVDRDGASPARLAFDAATLAHALYQCVSVNCDACMMTTLVHIHTASNDEWQPQEVQNLWTRCWCRCATQTARRQWTWTQAMSPNPSTQAGHPTLLCRASHPDFLMPPLCDLPYA